MGVDLGSRGHAGANSVSSITTSAEVGHRAQIDQRQGAETGCRNRVQNKVQKKVRGLEGHNA
jgi:hypothetical protein